MCSIKTGAAIKTQADVRNLVLALILRQEGTFEKEKLQILAEQFLTNSIYKTSERELKEIISGYLDLLCRNKELNCDHGCYIGKTV